MSPMNGEEKIRADLEVALSQRVNPAVVYSSPYRRAIETARAITHDVVVDQRLVEIALEIDEDGTLDFQEMPDVAAARMRAVLNDVVSKHPGERVIIVGVSTLRVLGDRWMVGSLGDVAHLE